MIEYIYDAIKATAGEDILVNAKITEDNGAEINQGCYFALWDDEKELIRVVGVYSVDTWQFLLPASETENLKGRFWYCIGCTKSSLSFKQPLYLV